MLEFLQSIDEAVFHWINHDLSNVVFDGTLVFFRNKYFWVPLYIFLIAKTILNYKKYGYIILLSVVVVFSITDYFSSSILKPTTERIRPCNNETLREVKVKAPCRNSFSFVSSHASNHTAIALFFFFLYRRQKSKWPILLLIWAGIISFAQIYVGLHYPGDVLFGCILGAVISTLGYRFLNRYYLTVYNVS